MNKIMTQPEKVDYILTRGCKYFGIAKADLVKNIGAKSYLWDKKRVLAYILDKHTPANIKDIQKSLGYKSHATILFHISKMEDSLSDQVYGDDKIKMVYKELIQYLEL